MEKITKILKIGEGYTILTLLSGLIIALGLVANPFLLSGTLCLLIIFGFTIFYWDRIIHLAVPLVYLGFSILAWPLGKLNLGFPVVSFLILPFLIHGINLILKRNLSGITKDWPMMIMLSLFTTYVLLSLSWTSNYDYGSKKAIIYFIQAFLPALILLTCHHSSITMKHVGFSLQVLACVTAVELLFFGTEEVLYSGRTVLPGTNPIWLSRIAVLGLIASIWNIMSLKGKDRLLFQGITIVLSLWVVIVTGSRGPAVAFIIASIIVVVVDFLSQRSIHKMSRYFIHAIISIIILFAPILIFPEQSFRYVGIMQNPEDVSLDDNVISRMQSFRKAYLVFEQNPFVGKGIGGYSDLAREYPHNLVLEILSEGGVIGIILFIGVVIRLFKKVAVKDKFAVSKKTLFMTTLLFALTSGDLGSNYEWLILGVFLSRVKSEPIDG